MDYMKVSLQDKNTFNQVFNDFYPSLVFFANKYLEGKQEISKDVVQEVFFKLLKNKKEFENISSLKGYLYSSVKNACLDHHKHNKIKQLYIEQSGAADHLNYQNEIIFQEEVYRHLLNAIDRLPNRCREIYTLTLKGIQTKEIAELMGISTETVKSQKKRGKELLGKMLKHMGVLLWGLKLFMGMA